MALPWHLDLSEIGGGNHPKSHHVPNINVAIWGIPHFQTHQCDGKANAFPSCNSPKAVAKRSFRRLHTSQFCVTGTGVLIWARKGLEETDKAAWWTPSDGQLIFSCLNPLFIDYFPDVSCSFLYSPVQRSIYNHLGFRSHVSFPSPVSVFPQLSLVISGTLTLRWHISQHWSTFASKRILSCSPHSWPSGKEACSPRLET